jgi:uncharacterized protein
MSWLKASSEGAVLINVWLQPRAAKSEVVGVHDDALKIKLTAPPVDGKANAELRAFLSRRLDIPAAAIALLQGSTGRRKLIEINGLSVDEVKNRLQSLTEGT